MKGKNCVVSKHPYLSALVRGQVFAGVLMIQKMSNFHQEAPVSHQRQHICREPFLRRNKFSDCSPGLPNRSRGFIWETICTGEIHILPGDIFRFLFPRKNHWGGCAGIHRPGCIKDMFERKSNWKGNDYCSFSLILKSNEIRSIKQPV